MIKISNIKSIVTWDVDQKKVIHIDKQSIYLKDKKIFKITNQDLLCEHEIDAENAIITPGFIDCHTHPIFTSSRANEFNLRALGHTYEQIEVILPFLTVKQRL